MSSPYGDSGSHSSGSSSRSGSSSGSSGSSSAKLGDTSTADGIVASARSERDDFHFGDDRAIGSPPNWASHSSRQLYDGAVNNNEPGTAEELGAQWTHQGDDLQTAADTLYEAISEISGAWVGQASGAAQGSLVGVANASSTAGDAAKAMGKRMQDQALAAAEVKKMPPPKDFSIDQWLAAGLAGGPAAMASDAKAQWDASNAVQAEQQRYMDAYTKSMSDVDGATPSFGPESIGLKPVEGSSYGSGNSGSSAAVTVGDAGPGVSGIGGSADGAIGKLGLGTGNLNMGSTGSPLAADVGDVQNASLREPLSTTGSGQVSTAATGPGAGAALGTAALGAGLGFAGAKALGRDGNRAGRKDDKDQTPEPVSEVEETEGDEQPEGRPEDLGVAAGGHAVQQSGPGGPQFGQPVAGQPSAPMSTPFAPQFSAPVQAQVPMAPGAPAGPFGAEVAPLAEGATSGAADPSTAGASQQGATASVAAGSEQHHAPSAAQQQAQAFQHQQAQAAGAMAPPMQPMGGGAGMAGAAGAGGEGGGSGSGSGAEHPAASYLIRPDPDDVFGPTEAVTSGVIGEDPEDD